MSLTPRRQREGLRWRTEKPPRIPLWQTMKDAALVIAALLGLLLAHGWAVEQDLKAQLEDQQRLARQANVRTVCAYVKPGWPRLQCQDAARK